VELLAENEVEMSIYKWERSWKIAQTSSGLQPIETTGHQADDAAHFELKQQGGHSALLHVGFDAQLREVQPVFAF